VSEVWSPQVAVSVVKAGTSLELNVPATVNINTAFRIDGWLRDEKGRGLSGLLVDVVLDGVYLATVTTYVLPGPQNGYYHYDYAGFPYEKKGTHTFQTKYYGDGVHAKSESRLIVVRG